MKGEHWKAAMNSNSLCRHCYPDVPDEPAAPRVDPKDATIAALRAALREACRIGMRINEQCGGAGDEDDVRLGALAKLADGDS